MIGRAGFCRLKVPESFQKHLAYIGALRRTFRLLRRSEPVGRTANFAAFWSTSLSKSLKTSNAVSASVCTRSAWY